MTHDASIPEDIHTKARAYLRDALGSFWSSVFDDRDLVDATMAARVLSVTQLYVDAMEALSLRDHKGAPVFHREHWLPVKIRRSQRNSGCGLHVGMEDRAVIGPQTATSNPGHVYLDGEVFKIGENAEYSKVVTYPLISPSGCRLVRVGTCMCDSITEPSHTLVQGRDFEIRDGVFIVRKEKDPFGVSGYRVEADCDDEVLCMWACDAETDTNNVGDFMSYPLGLSVSTDDRSAKAVSALWDVMIYGVTPRHLNAVLGSVFGVATVEGTETVESVSQAGDDGTCVVVTSGNVYRVERAHLRDCVYAGAVLSPGTFLTDEITVYRGISNDGILDLISRGALVNLAIPRGCVLGVDENVVLENIESPLQDGGWFRLSAFDSADSPFWSAVFSRTTLDERVGLFNSLVTGKSDGVPVVNPIKALGYTVLANTVLVTTSRPMVDRPYSRIVFSALSGLFPAFSGLLVVQFVRIDDACEEAADDVSAVLDVVTSSSVMGEASDDVGFSFVPDAVTEV